MYIIHVHTCTHKCITCTCLHDEIYKLVHGSYMYSTSVCVLCVHVLRQEARIEAAILLLRMGLSLS